MTAPGAATLPSSTGAALPARWTWVTAAALAASAAGHLLAAADHRDHALTSVFFLAVAAAQLTAAGWLGGRALTRWPPRPAPVALALAGTVALLALYVLVHATGLLDTAVGGTDPTGTTGHGGAPHAAGGPTGEEAGLLGTATVGAELVATVGLLALLPPGWRGRAADAVLAAGALLWVAWLVGGPS